MKWGTETRPVPLRRIKVPLTKKGIKIFAAMQKQYGKVRGKKVFYASAKKKTIKGVH
jgi:hypothetical protein